MNRCDVQFFVTSHGMNQQFVSEVVSDWKVIGFVGGSGIVLVSKTTNAKEDDSTRAENLVFLVTVGLNAAIGISVKHNLVLRLEAQSNVSKYHEIAVLLELHFYVFSSLSVNIGLKDSIRLPISKSFSRMPSISKLFDSRFSVGTLFVLNGQKPSVFFPYFWLITVFKFMFPIIIGLIGSIKVPEKKSFFFKRKSQNLLGRTLVLHEWRIIGLAHAVGIIEVRNS